MESAALRSCVGIRMAVLGLPGCAVAALLCAFVSPPVSLFLLLWDARGCCHLALPSCRRGCGYRCSFGNCGSFPGPSLPFYPNLTPMDHSVGLIPL